MKLILSFIHKETKRKILYSNIFAYVKFLRNYPISTFQDIGQ